LPSGRFGFGGDETDGRGGGHGEGREIRRAKVVFMSKRERGDDFLEEIARGGIFDSGGFEGDSDLS
jgi:hypothetical protein